MEHTTERDTHPTGDELYIAPRLLPPTQPRRLARLLNRLTHHQDSNQGRPR